jgi:uncharacterized protein DUF742
VLGRRAGCSLRGGPTRVSLAPVLVPQPAGRRRSHAGPPRTSALGGRPAGTKGSGRNLPQPLPAAVLAREGCTNERHRRPASAHRRRVRPYSLTGGRTRPTHDDLEIEALVATTSVGEQTPKLTVEQRAIAALCHDLLSIAEVSAQLHLPLGVIRVLVADMADEHLVIVYRPAHAGDRPDLALLERVLCGLRTR